MLVPNDLIDVTVGNLSKMKMAKLGRRFVLTELEEIVLTRILSLAAKWGCPYETNNIKEIVRDYLNSTPRKAPEFGETNTPSDDWVRAYVLYVCITNYE